MCSLFWRPNIEANALTAIDRSEPFGVAQDGRNIGKTPPQGIVEYYDCHRVGIAQKRQAFGQLPQVDRTGEILQRAVVAMSGFAADVFECPKKATLAIVSAISAAGPSDTPVEEEFHHIQNDRSL